jgi:plastocyanin
MSIRRDIYLRIETIPGYSPVNPDDDEANPYKRDCLRGPGHEDARIPDTEVEMRRFDALVYREYQDPAYLVPNMAPMVAADINEPRADRRVPSAVVYAQPGERLYIHVLNADVEPHSLHLHGLLYGIDSDGSWPLGVQSADGRRSDEICPGQSWTYVFDATEHTVGAWPFHDHHMGISASANRGLVGAVVVRDPKAPKADHEIPLFFQRLAGPRRSSLFDSGTLNPGDAFNFTFTIAGNYQYMCRFHPMTGTVHVVPGAPASASVNIMDGPSRFDPAEVSVAPGGTITWHHAAMMPHTVTDAGGGGKESMALNGRSFLGNTPTIVVQTGKRLRWYVFNLDLGTAWHNFHPHGQRWDVAGQTVDVRSLSPAESFVADTIAPPVILPPEDEGSWEGEDHEGRRSKSRKQRDYDEDERDKGKPVKLRGDFLVHCHVEDHMMDGMAAIVRATQTVRVTPGLEERLGFKLPLDDGSTDCPMVDMDRCSILGGGSWESAPDSPIFVVHAAVLHSGNVLLFSGGAEAGYPLQSRVWDPATFTMRAQNFGVDLFCSGHAFLADGRVLVMGGAPGGTVRQTQIFDPVAESWTRVQDMSQTRWYPTALTLQDGRILAVSGQVSPVEVYDPGPNTWTTVAGADRYFSELYPSLHLLPSGDVFYSRAGWAAATGTQSGYLHFGGPAAATWTDLGQQRFYDREEGTAVIQIDDTGLAPTARIFLIGGGVSGTPTVRNPQSMESIDVSSLTPAPIWTRLADMHFPRTNVNGTLLPDGTILALGGQRAGKWAADPQPVLQPEIYDPATDTWTLMAPMQHPRQYHSISVLLPDGRVLTAGGVDPTQAGNTPPARDQRYLEVFSPPYLARGPRPVVTAMPPTAAYGGTFNVTTPDAARIDSVALLRPCAMTHHTDAGQRYIRARITARTANRLTVQVPADGRTAPPGYYMVFVVTADGIPSEGRFIRIS